MDRRTFLNVGLAVPALGQAAKSLTQTAPRAVPWTQWGGPHRNFQTETGGLRDSWPASGPRVIWKRPIGEGYSSTIVEGNMLFAMYGRRGEEIVLAANAETGATIWEHPIETVAKSELADYERRYQVVSVRLLAGRPLIHIHSETDPADGFTLIEPDLEDVYFQQLGLSAAKAAA